MSLLELPWLEIALAAALVGTLIVSQLRVPLHAFACGMVFMGVTLAATLLAWLGFHQGVVPIETLQTRLLGRDLFALDELSAPLLPAVALLHFLTALATARTKMRRFSFSWSLASEALRLAMFSSQEAWILIILLLLGTVPPYIELVNRRKPTRVFVAHMSLFGVLLVSGWWLVDQSGGQNLWASLCLLGAILVRCGAIPVHCWLTDWCEHASFGNGLLFVAPLLGVLAALRLVFPIAPGWVLSSIGIVSLTTALYAAALALVQIEARRFFAYLFLSHASLVLVGLELCNATSLTGALCLWISVMIGLGGFGLTLRALEARYGPLRLDSFQGLYQQSPTLAVCFFLTGFASVGFPGTIGFVANELLVDGAVEFNIYVGFGVVAAAAFNGIAVMRAYFLLFTGGRRESTVSLHLGLRERIAVLTLASLILIGGIVPQPGVANRNRAAQHLLERRGSRVSSPMVSSSKIPTSERHEQ